MASKLKIIIYFSPIWIPLISFIVGIIFIWSEYGPIYLENISWIFALSLLPMLIGVIVGGILNILDRVFPKIINYLVITCIVSTILISILNVNFIKGAYII